MHRDDDDDVINFEVGPSKQAVELHTPSNENWRSVCLQSEMPVQPILTQNWTPSVERESCLLQCSSTALNFRLGGIYRREGGGKKRIQIVMSVALDRKKKTVVYYSSLETWMESVHMLINLLFVFPSWSELFEISGFMTFEMGVRRNCGPHSNNETSHEFCLFLRNNRYRGADNSLARPDWKNDWKVANFLPTRRSLLPRRPGRTDNVQNCFWVACEI